MTFGLTNAIIPAGRIYQRAMDDVLRELKTCRHRSQTRVSRCCALQDHAFRHTAACPLLCPGWSH